MVNGLPASCEKIQHSNSAPPGTATRLVTRQPPGERSRNSPSPATLRPFDEKWLCNRTATRTCRRVSLFRSRDAGGLHRVGVMLSRSTRVAHVSETETLFVVPSMVPQPLRILAE